MICWSAVVAGSFFMSGQPVRWGCQLFANKVAHATATCTSHAFENSYRFRPFRLHRPRSVLWCRSTNAAFTTRLTADRAGASSGPNQVPNTGVVLDLPPFSGPFGVRVG